MQVPVLAESRSFVINHPAWLVGSQCACFKQTQLGEWKAWK